MNLFNSTLVLTFISVLLSNPQKPHESLSETQIDQKYQQIHDQALIEADERLEKHSHGHADLDNVDSKDYEIEGIDLLGFLSDSSVSVSDELREFDKGGKGISSNCGGGNSDDGVEEGVDDESMYGYFYV